MSTSIEPTQIPAKLLASHQRSAFVSGVEWVARQLEAAATLVEADRRGEIAKDDKTFDVVTKTGQPHFATHLRNLAATLRFEASRQATELYPNWKE